MYGDFRWWKRFKMLKVILQSSQDMIEKSRRWSVSIRSWVTAWYAAAKDGSLDWGGAFGTVTRGSNLPEISRNGQPLCI